jgi:hypothetical protein
MRVVLLRIDAVIQAHAHLMESIRQTDCPLC